MALLTAFIKNSGLKEAVQLKHLSEVAITATKQHLTIHIYNIDIYIHCNDPHYNKFSVLSQHTQKCENITMDTNKNSLNLISYDSSMLLIFVN